MDPNDANRPRRLLVPFWGPDGYSLRMAIRNFFFANPAYSALSGVGVRPAPAGSSVTERTKSDAWMPPRQQFRSWVGDVPDPTIKNVPLTAQYPDTVSLGVPPWLVEMSRHQVGGWS